MSKYHLSKILPHLKKKNEIILMIWKQGDQLESAIWLVQTQFQSQSGVRKGMFL